MTSPFSISPIDLLPRLGTAQAPVLLDVQRDPAFEASSQIIAGAQRCAPQDVAAWAAANAAQRHQPIVVYCVYGHNVSDNAMHALRGLDLMHTRLLAASKGAKMALTQRRTLRTGAEQSYPLGANALIGI